MCSGVSQKWSRRAGLGPMLVICTVLPLALPAGSIAQDNQEQRQTAAELAPISAPVTVDGRVLFRVVGISAYPAAQRAKTISGRIKELARRRDISPDELRVVEAPHTSNIVAGERLVAGVVDADAQTEGVSLSRPVLAEVYKKRIAEAVRAYRHDRTARALLMNSLYAAGATIVIAVVLFLVPRAFRRLRGTIERRYKERISTLRIQQFPIIHAEQLWNVLRGALRTAQVAVLLIASYTYLYYVLSLYPWTRQLGQHLLDPLLQPLSAMAAGIVDSIPNLVFIAILVVVVRYVLKMARLFFSTVASRSIAIPNFDPEWAWPTYKIIRLLIIAFAVVMAYPYIPGSNSAAFKGVSILLGVIFSLGSTSLVANIIAGYTMTYRRAFRVGDRIKVGDLVGDVVAMRLLVTHLRSLKNEELVVPNSVILNSNIVNYSTMAGEKGLILHTTVGIGYEVPWRQVDAMLKEAAARTPGLLRDPAPFVLQTSLGDFSVTYELNAFCDSPSAMQGLYTALHQNILDVFNEYGVQIMTPAYEHDPEQPKVVPKDQWFPAPSLPGRQAGARNKSP